MDESTPVTDDRIPAGGESRAARATRRASAAVQRPAPPLSGQSPRVGTETADRGHFHRDSGDFTGLASQTDRAEIRRQWPARTGAPAPETRDRGVSGSLGRRKSGWGYRRIQGALSHLGDQIAHSTIADILE